MTRLLRLSLTLALCALIITPALADDAVTTTGDTTTGAGVTATTAPVEAAAPVFDITTKDVEGYGYIGKRMTVDPAGQDMESMMGESFYALIEYMVAENVEFTGHSFAIYHAAGPEVPVWDFEIAIPTTSTVAAHDVYKGGQVEGGRVATATVNGPYDMATFTAAYEQLFGWIGANGFAPAGAPRELYIQNPGTTENPAEYITEIQVPIAPAEASADESASDGGLAELNAAF